MPYWVLTWAQMITLLNRFACAKLVSRVRAVLRRQEGAREQPELLHQGDIILDRSEHLVKVRGTEVQLTPIEFDLLAALTRSPGQVFTRTQLVDLLLESGFTGLDRTLNVHIRNLRAKIEKDPSEPEFIRNGIWGWL